MLLRYNLLASRSNASLTAARQIGALPALGLWALLTLAGALFANWYGYGGRSFAALLTAGAFFLLVMLLFAARGIQEFFAGALGAGSGFLLGVFAYFAYIVYAVGTGSFSYARAGAIAGFVFVPLALAVSAERESQGAWQDYLTLALIWVCVKFGPTHWVWPYPGGHLAYVYTVILAVTVAIAAFLLIRRVDKTGYLIAWGPRWASFVLASFLVFAAMAIPLGRALHFIAFDPLWYKWPAWPATFLAILLFTAWPEEFLFRGLLQNFLQRSTKSDLAGWWSASILFGFSHITNLGFPNWRYVLLASIAGLFYGWTWRKTGSIFASALVHAGVDATWHFFFRTL
jgi:membrane protease YdiL (CAAX protease family)